MQSNPRGQVLIINNEKFQELKERRGATVDTININNIFEQLHFKVQLEDNLGIAVSAESCFIQNALFLFFLIILEVEDESWTDFIVAFASISHKYIEMPSCSFHLKVCQHLWHYSLHETSQKNLDHILGSCP